MASSIYLAGYKRTLTFTAWQLESIVFSCGSRGEQTILTAGVGSFWPFRAMLGRMTMWKNPPLPLVTLPNPVLSCLSGHSDPIDLKPFVVTLWYSGVPQTPNLLKISSDIESDFRKKIQHIAHRFEGWIEFLWPLLTKLQENAFVAATGSIDAW